MITAWSNWLESSVDESFCYACLKQNGKLCSRQRPAEEVPLSFLTMVGLKVRPLFLRFDALGDHNVLEALSHANDRVHDG